MELPKEKVKASRKSPKNMIIYGPPKIGKTSVLAELDDCFLLNFSTNFFTRVSLSPLICL